MMEFKINDYVKIIKFMRNAGCVFTTVGGMPSHTNTKDLVVMRHDIDLHPCACDSMANAEYDMGISSTYYVLLTGHYNPKSKKCRAILKRLVGQGHEIGLHYDLEQYPQEINKAKETLDNEVAVLSDICECKIESISCHQPHKGLPDPFRFNEQYIHCHDPRYNNEILYVSDSCRAWRDDKLQEYLNGELVGYRGVQLLTHPEAWLAESAMSRMAYLEEILMPIVTEECKNYLDIEVRSIWEKHEAAKMHDARMKY